MTTETHTQTQTHTMADPWSASDPADRLFALVVVWCPRAPERVGEVVLVPAVGQWVLGRGDPSADDPFPRLLPCRQRPDGLAPAGPLRMPSVSRVQWLLSASGEGLSVSVVGRCATRVNGARATGDVEVREGDVLELARKVVFRVSTRPSRLAAVDGPLHPFGGPDDDGLVGESPGAWSLRQEVAFAAPRRAHVLVHGPSGSGKELVARALHARSLHPGGPFVARNAATIPEGLVDAELFGHARGYPHAGMPEREGLIGAADGGTLFLDEFAELPEALQAHLLRVLDAGEYQRLGETRTRRSSFRLIAATNRPLATIKHDVLARLPLVVEVPELAERIDDVPLLARHLLRRIAAEDPALATQFFVGGRATGEPRLTARLVRALLQHDWATNVRELEAWLWRAMRGQGTALDLATVPTSTVSSSPSSAWLAWRGTDPAELPAEVVQACLDEHNGVQETAWRALGLSSRYVLVRLIKKHGLVVRKTPT